MLDTVLDGKQDIGDPHCFIISIFSKYVSIKTGEELITDLMDATEEECCGV